MSEINDHRHECEVRYVLAMSSMRRMKEYMDAVEVRRGKANADKLRDDVREQLKHRRRKHENC